MKNINKLISPKSIAIIGASKHKDKIGYQILNNIKESGYSGDIFPVNPNDETILGLKCFINLSSIKKAIDLAIIVIPAPYVLDIVKECALNNVSSIIIISSGFREIGKFGIQIEDQIIKICNDNDIALLGPNCLGLINTDCNLNASFASFNPAPGNVSFISQSGAIISSLIDWSATNSVGFSKIFSVGNKAQIDESYLLEYLYLDKKTEVILLYLEELTASSKMTNILIKYSKTKPTIVFFGGKTNSGSKASMTHTGSIVTSYIAVETYLKQSGIIIAESLKGLFLLAKLFSKYQKLSNKNVGIITNAGGPSIAACDAIDSRNLVISKIAKSTINKINNNIDKKIVIKNPLDLLGDATDIEYIDSIEALEKDKFIDVILVIITKQSSTDVDKIAKEISKIKIKKLLIVVIIGGDENNDARNILNKSSFPVFKYPEEAVISLSKLVEFSLGSSELLEKNQLNQNFNSNEQYETLSKFNIPALQYYEVNSFAEACRCANKIGFPVVLKTTNPNISHKTEKNAVLVNIKNRKELEAGLEKFNNKAKIGKMIKGIELFLGAKKDKNIGFVLTFGAGGIYSEIYQDFSYRILPLNKSIALKMINETKISKILHGARGQKSLDLDKLSDILVSVSKFLESFSNISELDFNPIIANNRGYYIVDTRIVIEKEKNEKI